LIGVPIGYHAMSYLNPTSTAVITISLTLPIPRNSVSITPFSPLADLGENTYAA